MKHFSEYTNPALAVDLVVFGYEAGRLSVLLLNRKEDPFKGRWTLPGAFVQPDETLIQTCGRVLRTKLGIDDVYLEQLYMFDAPGRDPRGRVIAAAHFALINPAKVKIVAGSMANDVKWAAADRVPALGFDHKQIFKTALERLRARIRYHPVGFGLLDDHFTMPELHQLYETILDAAIDRRNFSRKILASGAVESTGQKQEGAQNRRPDLYRFNRGLKEHQFHLNL